MNNSNDKSSKKQIRNQYAKRLAAYSAAAAATTLTTNSTTNAAEIIHNIPDQVIGTGLGVMFNMVNGTYTPATSVYSNSTQGVFRAGAYYFDGYAGVYAPAGSAPAAFVGTQGFVPINFSATPLVSSTNVGPRPSDQWGAATSYQSSYGNYAWLDSFPNAGRFVGLRFTLGTDTYYGWAHVSGGGVGKTLNAFGYNDANIRTHLPSRTQIPEPSGVAMLAMGAAGVAAWRKRRAA